MFVPALLSLVLLASPTPDLLDEVGGQEYGVALPGHETVVEAKRPPARPALKAPAKPAAKAPVKAPDKEGAHGAPADARAERHADADGNHRLVRVSVPASASAPASHGVSAGIAVGSGRAGAPRRSPRWGQSLVVNGGFTGGLDHWQVVLGEPNIRLRDPASSDWALMAGTGDMRVIQDFDLRAEGVTAAHIKRGVKVTLEATTHARKKPGLFDDQGFAQLMFLGQGGRLLGSVRSIMAQGSAFKRLVVQGWLPPGAVTMRLELVGRHRRDNRNDAWFDDLGVVLVKAPAAKAGSVRYGPILHGHGNAAITALWETRDMGSRPRLQWREIGTARPLTEAAVETVQLHRLHHIHRAKMGPLEAGKRYAYRIVMGKRKGKWRSLRPAPKPGDRFRMTVLADNQNGSRTFAKIVKHLNAANPDFALFPGDVVQHGQVMREWWYQWFKPLSQAGFGATTPIVIARGNHDGESPTAYAYTALPGNEAWFAYSYSDVRFIIVDTEASQRMSPQQHAWLKAELKSDATQDARLRVVVMHKPAYSNLWDRPVYDGTKWIREAWVPLFEANRVELVIAGHAHAYQRMQRNGVTYVVSGGGGGRLDDVVSGEWPMDVMRSVHHYNIVDYRDGRLRWVTKDLKGDVIDRFEVRPRPAH